MTIPVAEANAILAEMFASWVLALGITAIETSAEGAVLTIPFSTSLTRVGGMMSGQALAAGADTAMVIALSSSLGGFKPVTTVDLATTFMRPLVNADARISARVIRVGRSLAFTACDIHESGSGKLAAHATATYAMPG